MITNTHLFVVYLLTITVLFGLSLREFVALSRIPAGHASRAFPLFNGCVLLFVSVGLAWGGVAIRDRYLALEVRVPPPPVSRMAIEVMPFVERGNWIYETSLARDVVLDHYAEVGPAHGFTPVRDSRGDVPVLLLEGSDGNRLFILVEERPVGRRIHVSTQGYRSDVSITTITRTP